MFPRNSVPGKSLINRHALHCYMYVQCLVVYLAVKSRVRQGTCLACFTAYFFTSVKTRKRLMTIKATLRGGIIMIELESH